MNRNDLEILLQTVSTRLEVWKTLVVTPQTDKISMAGECLETQTIPSIDQKQRFLLYELNQLSISC